MFYSNLNLAIVDMAIAIYGINGYLEHNLKRKMRIYAISISSQSDHSSFSKLASPVSSVGRASDF